jgi:regulator of sigma E protease
LDKSEPVTPPAGETPERPAGLGGWLSANLAPLVFVTAVVAVIIWKDLDFVPVLLAVLGLGLVIFIHELGHFLAAKACDVHVETFSIGFGKALPFCQFRRGETLYKVGWIPLGGYVKMVGEGENADTEEADEDPRSFKNKKVWQRMVIISAGVVMNLILGGLCFVVAYSHGVEETPAVVGSVGIGSPAWEADLRAGYRITQIDTIADKVTFDDIRPEVMGAPKGGSVFFKVRDTEGRERETPLVPRRTAEDLYPLVGINPVKKLVLPKVRKSDGSPVFENTPAHAARDVAGGTPFRSGDRIVGVTTDPERPEVITPISPNDPLAFDRALHQMRGHDMIVRVDRDGTQLDFKVAPASTKRLMGVRFQMGRVAALRAGGPAARATPETPGEAGFEVARADVADSGDKIIAVEVADGPVRRRFVEELSQPPPKDVTEEQFDPLKLGFVLEQWAERATDRTVKVTVLRPPTGGAKTETRKTFTMTWDPALVHAGEVSIGPSGPTSISGLGLAYYVNAIVDAVDPSVGSPLAKGDIVTEVRLQKLDKQGQPSPDKWIKLKQYQAVYLHYLLQVAPTNQIDFKVKRGGIEQEVTATIAADVQWPAVDRGFVFQYDTQTQQADGWIDALKMGWHRTARTIKVIYQTLYATIFRQISAETMSGPLSIANASYNIAGNDIWQFIIFIGLININLAVVNFLPIPLLDGGHMVFLLYEKIRGKPAPEKVQEWSMWGGLAFILLLMGFVIYLDVRKLIL